MAGTLGNYQTFSLRCQIEKTDYVITEIELLQLEKGPQDQFKDFFLATVGLSIPCILNLFGYLEDPFKWSYPLFLNTMVGGICFLASIILGNLWWKNRGSVKKIIQDIRNKPKIEVQVISTGSTANTEVLNASKK